MMSFKILWIGDIWIYHWIISKFNQFLSSYVPVGASSELRLVYKNIIHCLRPAGCMPTDRCMSLSFGQLPFVLYGIGWCLFLKK